MNIDRPTAEHFEPTNCGRVAQSRKVPVSNAQRSK